MINTFQFIGLVGGAGAPKRTKKKWEVADRGRRRLFMREMMPQSPARAQHITHSSPVPPLPSFVFTLAATGTTLSISIFSSAEYSV